MGPYSDPFGDTRLQNDVSQLKSDMNTKIDRWEAQRMIDEAITRLKNDFLFYLERDIDGVRQDIRDHERSSHGN